MFHVKVLFYLTQVRWPLVCNVILQLWSCPLIFNILFWPQVSISYLFSHIIHINIKGKSPAKLPSALKAVSQIIVSCSHSEATYDAQRCCLASFNTANIVSYVCFTLLQTRVQRKGKKTPFPEIYFI